LFLLIILAWATYVAAFCLDRKKDEDGEKEDLLQLDEREVFEPRLPMVPSSSNLSGPQENSAPESASKNIPIASSYGSLPSVDKNMETRGRSCTAESYEGASLLKIDGINRNPSVISLENLPRVGDDVKPANAFNIKQEDSDVDSVTGPQADWVSVDDTTEVEGDAQKSDVISKVVVSLLLYEPIR
jgi:hypothetical protein